MKYCDRVFLHCGVSDENLQFTWCETLFSDPSVGGSHGPWQWGCAVSITVLSHYLYVCFQVFLVYFAPVSCVSPHLQLAPSFIYFVFKSSLLPSRHRFVHFVLIFLPYSFPDVSSCCHNREINLLHCTPCRHLGPPPMWQYPTVVMKLKSYVLINVLTHFHSSTNTNMTRQPPTRSWELEPSSMKWVWRHEVRPPDVPDVEHDRRGDLSSSSRLWRLVRRRSHLLVR